MKKKVLAVILLGMVMCLGGCGASENAGTVSSGSVQESQSSNVEDKKDEEPGPVESQDTSSSTETKEENTEASKEETSKEEEKEKIPENTKEYLKVTTKRTYDSANVVTEEWVSLMYGHYDSIRLWSEGYSKLANALEVYNKDRADSIQSYLDELEESARSELQEYGYESFRGPYVNQMEMFIRRADSQVLSVVETDYSYAGGAHGYTGFDSVNLDVQTGEEIPLDAVIPDKKSLLKVLETEISEKYPDLAQWTESLEEALQYYDAPLDPEMKMEFTWTLDYDGVTFYFGNYEIAAYVAGLQQVTLSYNEYPELMEGSYFTDISKDYVIALNDADILSDVDLTGDGTTDYISVRRNYDDFMDFSLSFDVTVNGNTIRQETYCYDLDTYLVKNDGKNYLYIMRTVENDYRSVCVFEITENSVEYVGEFNGGLEFFTNTKDFQVSKRFDMLSTYTGIANCYIGADGLPVEKEGAYRIDWEVNITSTVEIDAELIDDEGNLKGSSYTFPIGTTFRLLETDGATYVDVQADDGQRCRFYVEPQWPQTINGMPAEDCFETLWYAG